MVDAGEEPCALTARLAEGLASADQAIQTDAARQCNEALEEIGEGYERLIGGLLHVLDTGSDEGRYWACYAVYNLGACSTAAKFALGTTESLYASLRGLIVGGELCLRLAACMALAMLSEVFSGNSTAEGMAMRPAMLEALVSAMNCPDGGGEGGEDEEEAEQDAAELKDCAAVVLHNASNIPRVAALIVRVPGMLDTLKDLCLGPRCALWGRGDAAVRFSKASMHGLCIMNNLAKHSGVLGPLREAGIGRGLTKLCAGRTMRLHYAASGLDEDEENVIFVASAMAAAKLCEEEALPGLRVGPEELGMMVLSLRHALNGEPWMGILWGVSECLLPLASLAECAENRAALADSGLIKILLRILNAWQRRHRESGARTRSSARWMGLTSDRASSHFEGAGEDWGDAVRHVESEELELSLLVLCRLGLNHSCFEQMRKGAGGGGGRAADVLRAIANVIRGSVESEEAVPRPGAGGGGNRKGKKAKKKSRKAALTRRSSVGEPPLKRGGGGEGAGRGEREEGKGERGGGDVVALWGKAAAHGGGGGVRDVPSDLGGQLSDGVQLCDGGARVCASLSFVGATPALRGDSAFLSARLWCLDERVLALQMAMHPRLGGGSLAGQLDPHLWGCIVQKSCRNVQVVCEALAQRLDARRPPSEAERLRETEA